MNCVSLRPLVPFPLLLFLLLVSLLGMGEPEEGLGGGSEGTWEKDLEGEVGVRVVWWRAEGCERIERLFAEAPALSA